MDLAPEQKLHGFTVRTREELPEIDGTAYVLDHDKSGAQLLYLRNGDNNKAFSIAFKTPPADDTGCSTSWSTRCCAAPTSSPSRSRSWTC